MQRVSGVINPMRSVCVMHHAFLHRICAHAGAAGTPHSKSHTVCKGCCPYFEARHRLQQWHSNRTYRMPAGRPNKRSGALAHSTQLATTPQPTSQKTHNCIHLSLHHPSQHTEPTAAIPTCSSIVQKDKQHHGVGL